MFILCLFSGYHSINSNAFLSFSGDNELPKRLFLFLFSKQYLHEKLQAHVIINTTLMKSLSGSDSLEYRNSISLKSSSTNSPALINAFISSWLEDVSSHFCNFCKDKRRISKKHVFCSTQSADNLHCSYILPQRLCPYVDRIFRKN